MSNVDTRQLSRDSLFLMARIKVEGEPTGHEHRVKVRNLSSGGMMAEGDMRIARGSLISVELRNIGWVEGSVAWRADNRFGIAFMEQIDPMLARANVPSGAPDLDTPRFVRPPLMPNQQPSSGKFRKV
jgi:hypothetical protein